ncbi:MAG TPA: zinc ribbon domain-containing protein [Candidatus Dormibacteraeota bacterium]|nr:zinc ribbon domain-containing protein [Candidatus Dormibacteraeota bacterium]
MSDYQQRVSGSFSERVRLIRFRRKKEKTRLRDEWRIVPRWLALWVLVLFLVAQAIGFIGNLGFHAYGDNRSELWPYVFRNNPALAALSVAGIITAAAIPIAIFLFLVGYVNKDAQRRGMHSGLWTLLVLILSPAWMALGFIIYFLVREPLPYNCPQCGKTLGPRYNFCPNCKTNLHPACPQCKHEVVETDKYCPNCAFELGSSSLTSSSSSASTPVERIPT